MRSCVNVLVAKEDGSICPAKYTFLALLGAQQQQKQCISVSSSAAATATLQQNPQHSGSAKGFLL
jgi:hypothetical protein